MKVSAKPTIRAVAVHEVPCDGAPIRKELDNYYESEGILAETAAYRARILPVVLIEVEVANATETFDVGDFTQEMELADEEIWQVAYEEAFLSPDGRELVRRDIGCADAVTGGRICFYFHLYDPGRPMLWTYGEFTCPPVTPVPEYLSALVPYVPI